MRTVFALVLIVLFGFAAWQYPSWNRARQQLKIAHERVQLVIDEGSQNLSLKDLNEIRRLPPNIKDAANLKFLDVSGTNILKLEGVGSLKNLERLDLSFTKVSDISELSGLSNLNSLNLHDTWVADLEPLIYLISLGELDIGLTQINSLEPVTRIPKLRWLNLHSSYALDGSLQYYNQLQTRVSEVFGGEPYRQNYKPDSQYLFKIRVQRISERWGLTFD